MHACTLSLYYYVDPHNNQPMHTILCMNIICSIDQCSATCKAYIPARVQEQSESSCATDTSGAPCCSGQSGLNTDNTSLSPLTSRGVLTQDEWVPHNSPLATALAAELVKINIPTSHNITRSIHALHYVSKNLAIINSTQKTPIKPGIATLHAYYYIHARLFLVDSLRMKIQYNCTIIFNQQFDVI